MDEIPAADLYVAGGSAALAALLLARGVRRPSRALAGGVAAGISLGILLALEQDGRWTHRREAGQEERLSFGRRLLRKIPTRVKLAAAFGAVKGGGREAGREIKRKVQALVLP